MRHPAEVEDSLRRALHHHLARRCVRMAPDMGHRGQCGYEIVLVHEFGACEVLHDGRVVAFGRLPDRALHWIGRGISHPRDA
jgi:hypothetical protein